MVTKVRGCFESFEGHAHLDAADPAAVVRRASTSTSRASRTGQPQRDEHLRTNDFFDVADLPGDDLPRAPPSTVDRPGHLRMTGDLTLKGVTKPVTIDFELTGTAGTRTATCAPASRAAPRSTAPTSASASTRRSRPGACSSARRSRWSSTSPRSRRPPTPEPATSARRAPPGTRAGLVPCGAQLVRLASELKSSATATLPVLRAFLDSGPPASSAVKPLTFRP